MPSRSLDFENVLVSGQVFAAPALLVDQQLVATVLTADTTRQAPRELVGSFAKFARVSDLAQLGTLVPERKREPGYARAESQLPISPAPAASDLLIYGHANDPAIRYQLPRYRLKEAAGVYELAISEDAGMWKISFGLEQCTASEIAEAARTAQQLPHAVQVTLSWGADIVRRIEPSEVAATPERLQVSFRMTLEERDALLRAFQSDSAHAKLSVARGIEVAVPIGSTNPTPPILFLTTDEHGALLHKKLAVLEASETPPVRPELEQASRVTRAVGKTIALQEGRAIAAEHKLRLNPKLLDRAQLGIVAPEPEPVVEAVPVYATRALSLPVDLSLRFDPAVHPYIFNLGLGGAQGPAFERLLVRFPPADENARAHAYFQDKARPDRFYYLPDLFRLARTEHAPFAPALAFRARNEDETQPGMEMHAYVRPSTENQRLLSAQAELAKFIPVRTGIGTTPILQPLIAPAKLRLHVPTGMVDSDAQVDLANGFWINANLTTAGFLDVFAVLAAGSDATSLLRGTISVSSGLSADDQVPVELRCRSLVGELFESTEAWDDANGVLQLTLKNATESALRIAALPVWLRRGAQSVLGQVSGVDLSAPVELAASALLSLEVRAAQKLAGSEPVDGVLDLSGITPLIESEALLEWVLDGNVARVGERVVQVRTSANQLAGGGDAQNQIDEIVVDFESGVSVSLTPSMTASPVRLPVPLIDVVLQRESTVNYRFRQSIFYTHKPPAASDWITDSAPTLLIPHP